MLPFVAKVKKDIRSKIVDGLLCVVVLLALRELLFLLLIPFRLAFETKAGILLYAVGMLAVSVFCLERSLLTRYSEPYRAWYGMVGGLVGWIVIEVSNSIEAVQLVGVAGIISLLLTALVVSILWRRNILPIGGRVYGLVILLSWVGHLLLTALGWLVKSLPFLGWIQFVAGGLCLAGGLLGIYLLMIKSDRRIQRLWYAVFIWYLLQTAFHLFIPR